MVTLSIFEDGIPPVFRIVFDDQWNGAKPDLSTIAVVTKRKERNTVSEQKFTFTDSVSTEFLQSTVDIPEPHEFDATLSFTTTAAQSYDIEFREEEGHHDSHENEYTAVDGKAIKHDVDNNYRAALLHVTADAFVSVLVIIALLIEFELLSARDSRIGSYCCYHRFNCNYWAYTLIVDATAHLLDMNPNPTMQQHLKTKIESDGSFVTDLHIWYLGPGGTFSCYHYNYSAI